jgi:two-component system, NarL family, sensor histidine kinase UhpB
VNASQCLAEIWRNRSILGQILAVMIGIELGAAIIGAAAIVYAQRQQNEAEMSAAMARAETLVQAEIAYALRRTAPESTLETVALRLPVIEPIEIQVVDPAGKVVSHTGAPDPADDSYFPEWYGLLVSPGEPRRVLPLEVADKKIGEVRLIGQPRENLEDGWDDLVELAMLAIAVNAAVFLLLYLTLSQILKPIGRLAQGLGDLERGHYEVRLPRPTMREVEVITERFNSLSAHLENARNENFLLSRRLINIQDDERRQIAAELHDELGPDLFGLSAELLSLRQLTGSIPEHGPKISTRVGRLLEIANRIKDLNRKLLRRLRPMSVGRVPLSDAIVRLLGELQALREGAEIEFRGQDLAASYGEAVDLTLYGSIREGVTNALRHADCHKVEIELREHANSRSKGRRIPNSLHLTIQDDGRGISPEAIFGYGLTGMTERVRGLGGEMTIGSGQNGGTMLELEIPYDKASVAAGHAAEPEAVTASA